MAEALGERYEVGPVLSDETPVVRHVFNVQNTTPIPVKILEVQASCSCTSTRLGKRELDPGETTQLELTSNLPKSYSQADLICSLITDHPTFREWRYSIHIESLPRVMITPQPIHLGEFQDADLKRESRLPPQSEPVEFQIDLFGSSKQEVSGDPTIEPVTGLTIRRIADSTDELSRNGIWHRRLTMDVSFDKGSSIGSDVQARSLLVKTAKSQASTSVTWRVVRPLVASPAVIHFGSVDATAAPIRRRLLIQSSEGKPFRITRIDCGEDIRIESPGPLQEARDLHLIDVRLAGTNPDPTGTVSGTIQLATDDARQAIIRVPWTAIVARPAIPKDRESSTISDTPEQENIQGRARRSLPACCRSAHSCVWAWALAWHGTHPLSSAGVPITIACRWGLMFATRIPDLV